ncbi:hypothetical protein SAMCCGM7_pA0291 (plasmid) [Sinorhizobium americanum CCGM7]|nr:hypothetical protein SAMCCGM7_pA0291 [Sinorhizobium americanum CCGM7]
MQRSGYVEALKHPDFINAVKGGRLGRIAVGYFEWAGLVNEDSVIPWQVIERCRRRRCFRRQAASAACRNAARNVGLECDHLRHVAD